MAAADISDMVIPPGEVYTVLNLDNNIPLANYLYDKLGRLEISVCYRSTFGDYWTLYRKGFQLSGERVAEYTEPSASSDLDASVYFRN